MFTYFIPQRMLHGVESLKLNMVAPQFLRIF